MARARVPCRRLTYAGPIVADFGDDIEGGGLGLTYIAPIAGGGVDVKLNLYTRRAWNLELKRWRVAPPTYRISDVVVAGRPATLMTRYKGDGSLYAQFLVIELGDTVIRAQTAAVIPLTPTASPLNPLLDEAAFLAVLENLRPYPE